MQNKHDEGYCDVYNNMNIDNRGEFYLTLPQIELLNITGHIQVPQSQKIRK